MTFDNGGGLTREEEEGVSGLTILEYVGGRSTKDDLMGGKLVLKGEFFEEEGFDNTAKRFWVAGDLELLAIEAFDKTFLSEFFACPAKIHVIRNQANNCFLVW